MSEALFAYGPYFALFGFAGAQLWRWGVHQNQVAPAVQPVRPGTEVALVVGFLVLVSGHFSTLVLPHAMTALLASPSRLAVIECVGLSGAVLFAYGVAGRFRARWAAFRAGDGHQLSALGVLGMVLAVCCTGILLSVTQRWITAWYAHLAAPYLRSLLVVDPQTAPVVTAPFLVRFHVVLFMLLLGLWPMGRLPMGELFPWRPVLRRLAGEAPLERAEEEGVS